MNDDTMLHAGDDVYGYVRLPTRIGNHYSDNKPPITLGYHYSDDKQMIYVFIAEEPKWVGVPWEAIENYRIAHAWLTPEGDEGSIQTAAEHAVKMVVYFGYKGVPAA